MTVELEEADMLDPTPDIHALFCHYNSLYFHDALGACILRWSSRRMTRCAGICYYQEGGGCEISISEPLLKYRSTADLKNTLLHEMIHAFLWITKNNRDHSDHGQIFQAIMDAINSSTVADHQRPSDGYNITIYHNFREEVDKYRIHHWICESCGDLIKRAVNREPSANDCIKHVGHHESCGISSCHWHKHKMLCGGGYSKIAEPPGYKDKKRKVSKGLKERNDEKPKGLSCTTRQYAHELQRTEGMKDKKDAKGPNVITNFFSVLGGSNKTSGSCSSSGCISLRDVKSKKSKALEPNTLSHALAQEIPKRLRTPMCRRKRKLSGNIRQKNGEWKQEIIVYSAWLDYYEYDGTDDDIEPLINKRTESRKMQKLLKISARQAPDFEAMESTIPCHTEDSFNVDIAKTTDPSLASEPACALGDRKNSRSLASSNEAFPSSPEGGSIIDISDG